MKWFGRSWQAPVNEDVERINVPVGEKCIICRDKLAANDRGVAMPFVSSDRPPIECYYHLSCWLKEIGVDDMVELRPNVIISNNDHLSEL